MTRKQETIKNNCLISVCDLSEHAFQLHLIARKFTFPLKTQILFKDLDFSFTLNYEDTNYCDMEKFKGVIFVNILLMSS